MTEETLSDKIIKGNSWSINSYNAYCDTEEIKKSIKKLKEGLADLFEEPITSNKFIDKIFGPKLTQEKN